MIKIVDKIIKFAQENGNAMDRALLRMAVDIDRMSKDQVPLDKGHLRASGHFTKKGFMNYIVSYNMVYARFQEFGGDATRTVKHYKYPGKKKFYLRDPGREISKRAIDYFKQEAALVRV